MKTYAVAPKENLADYLTPEKEYEVIDGQFSSSKPKSFTILNDLGDYSYCLAEHCAHINYQSWKFIRK